jgi:hypothetical protein
VVAVAGGVAVLLEMAVAKGMVSLSSGSSAYPQDDKAMVMATDSHRMTPPMRPQGYGITAVGC